MTHALDIQVPAWLGRFLAVQPAVLSTDESRMQLTIALARENVAQDTGGPFGAAVFDMHTGRLVAAGVNLVVSAGLSLAHAEMVALALAQRAQGSYDLGAGEAAMELVSSTEPCAMCLGAVPWSGVRRLVCGARAEDAARIGMDEGAKPGDWSGELRRRGIAVRRDVLREDAAAVLAEYARHGGIIYNGRGGSE